MKSLWLSIQVSSMAVITIMRSSRYGHWAIIYCLNHNPAETNNAVRAWVQQCEST